METIGTPFFNLERRRITRGIGTWGLLNLGQVIYQLAHHDKKAHLADQVGFRTLQLRRRKRQLRWQSSTCSKITDKLFETVGSDMTY